MKKIILFLLFNAVFTFNIKADSIPTGTTNPEGKPLISASSMADSLAAKLSRSLNNAVQNSTVITREVKCHCDSAKDTSNMWIAWTLMGIIVAGFIALALFSRVLRDPITDDEEFLENAANKNAKYAGKDVKEIPKPYSLARTQLGFWTVIISCSYVYLAFQCCEDTTSAVFNTTVLALMGISLGTAAIGGSIDKSQTDESRHQNTASTNWLIDIISDENGVSMHRFQNVVFTLIAMVIYIYKVCPCQPLPILDNTLLALTGASSAAYLGLKLNENKGNTPANTNTTTNTNTPANNDQDINPVG
ncbi:MAG: hypothetical protein K0S32_1586 [Bacteroidetes bacterium]|jgi:hypothetical protein|nr:hypothetical protein [Bacteroidota bacterium]